MSTFVLIVMIYSNNWGLRLTMQEFDSMRACNYAANQVVRMADTANVVANCVPKGDGK